MKRQLLLAVLLIALISGSANAMKVKEVITYQGSLSDSSGDPANGSFDMQFGIYCHPTEGTNVWFESHIGVPVVNGLFNVTLGEIVPMTADVFSGPVDTGEYAMRWLEITVGAEIITPRTQLHADPYAIATFRMAGDFFSKLGEIKIYPQAPDFSIDCTMAPIWMLSSDVLSAIRIRPPDLPNDCTYYPLEFFVDAIKSKVVIQPPEPVAPGEDVEPAIVMQVDSITAKFDIFAIPPDPVKADHGDPAISLSAELLQTSILVHNHSQDAGGDANAAYVEISSSPTTGASLLMFNPQPEPPADPFPIIAMNAAPGFKGSFLMFNPQPEPPADPAELLGMRTSNIGAEFEMQSEPVFSKAAGGPQVNISISADTSGGFLDITSVLDLAAGSEETGSVMISSLPGGEAGIVIINNRPDDGISSSAQMGTDLAGTGKAGIIIINNKPVGPGTNVGMAELKIDGASESLFMVDYHVEGGIQPCARMFSNGVGAGMSIYEAGAPSEGGKASSRSSGKQSLFASDSAVINLFADTASARIEMFGESAGSNASIVLISDQDGGRIGINTTTPTEQLHVIGNICATGTIASCSDARYKDNVETISDALGLIRQLNGVTFDWKTEEFPDQRFPEESQVGFIAQEIKEVLPEVVSRGTDGFYSVDYGKLTPILVEAVKAQQKQINELKNELAKNKQFEKEVQELKLLVQKLAVIQSKNGGVELAKTE